MEVRHRNLLVPEKFRGARVLRPGAERTDMRIGSNRLRRVHSESQLRLVGILKQVLNHAAFLEQLLDRILGVGLSGAAGHGCGGCSE